MKRRDFLTAAPASGVAVMLPGSLRASERSAVLAVLEELESWQGWESCDTVCTKAFAAYRLRQALGLDQPDLDHARDHLHFQNEKWEAYKRTIWFERDQEAGKHYIPPLPVSAVT